MSEQESSVAKYEVREAQDGQWYYVTIGRNGEDLSTSEMYTRKYDADRAAQEAYPGLRRQRTNL